MTDISLGPHESTILTFSKNNAVQRRYVIRVTSYSANNSNSSNTIDIDDIFRHVPPYDSDEIYVPFSYVTNNAERLLVSFFVRNNMAAENISRLVILFCLRAGGPNIPNEEFMFDVTFDQERDPTLCPTNDVSASSISVPMMEDVSSPPAPVHTATVDISTPPSMPVPTATVDDVSTLAMNCSDLINDIQTAVDSAVEKVCETSTIDQGSSIFGIPVHIIDVLLQVVTLVFVVLLWRRGNSSKLDHSITNGFEHSDTDDDSQGVLPARRNNKRGVWPGNELSKMPTIANFMREERRADETSAYNSRSTSGSSVLS